MALDLGGIAKLPILQAGMDVLAAHGVRDALVNGGGDVLIAGRLQGRPWRVGLRDAREPRRLLGVVALGTVCYGLWCFVQARYRRIRVEG